MPKPSLLKNSSEAIKPTARKIREFIPFPKGICSKLNIIARLDFELAYLEARVQHFSHYVQRIPPLVELFGEGQIMSKSRPYFSWNY